MPHARSGRDGRQEGRERSYYHLHCNLNNTLFHFLSKSFLILKFCASSAASPLTGVWYCRNRLSLGSSTDVKSLATFSSGPDPSERPRRNHRRNAPAEAPRLKLGVLRLLLRDPVLQRRHLLDVLLLGGITLLGREVYLLLHSVGGQRTHILEGHGRDLVLSASLGLEADVDALHVGVRVPLALQQGSPGDALLGALHGGHEGAESVDLDGVAPPKASR